MRKKVDFEKRYNECDIANQTTSYQSGLSSARFVLSSIDFINSGVNGKLTQPVFDDIRANFLPISEDQRLPNQFQSDAEIFQRGDIDFLTNIRKLPDAKLYYSVTRRAIRRIDSQNQLENWLTDRSSNSLQALRSGNIGFTYTTPTFVRFCRDSQVRVGAVLAGITYETATRKDNDFYENKVVGYATNQTHDYSGGAEIDKRINSAISGVIRAYVERSNINYKEIKEKYNIAGRGLTRLGLMPVENERLRSILNLGKLVRVCDYLHSQHSQKYQQFNPTVFNIVQLALASTYGSEFVKEIF